MSEPRVLTWRKAAVRGDGWSPVYEAHDAHGLADSAVQTGRYGADDYPWDWSYHLPLRLCEVCTRIVALDLRNPRTCETILLGTDHHHATRGKRDMTHGRRQMYCNDNCRSGYWADIRAGLAAGFDQYTDEQADERQCLYCGAYVPAHREEEAA